MKVDKSKEWNIVDRGGGGGGAEGPARHCVLVRVISPYQSLLHANCSNSYKPDHISLDERNSPLIE